MSTQKVKVTRACYVAGALLEVGNVYELPVAAAVELKTFNKAVDATDEAAAPKSTKSKKGQENEPL